MTIFIRQAALSDAKQVAPLIYEAIGEIANRLTGESNYSNIINELEVLFKRTDNRHSYLNTYVAEDDQTKDILGIIVLYSGKDAAKLDNSLQQWLINKNASIITIDVEAHPDEFYVDTICVHEKARGEGLGTKLLAFAETIALKNGFTKLSLNVELEKVKARHLYERVGFVVTEPWTIMNEPFHHMVKQIGK
ncbi:MULTISPECIES: GNAT family N-acetyltransferase [Lysinibacillus]|uniref:GNAT family N-acetyltransferase n=1 Tax=Lysinibacillus antri TaxID=2498145 RepID=A0A3S0PM96_9BACI|nr:MULTISPECIES: GNAT family N-acetyltransferase [Lysinibacillus]RUL47798.1 GNAT family N-acetyltransferase [Lysinibacillus antri]TSI08345.1 GNAT family N-acetyltransferase [Lysinibacillus sp. BW-2-10]